MNLYKIYALMQLVEPYLIRANSEAEAIAEFEKDKAEIKHLLNMTSREQPLTLQVVKQ